MSMAFWQGLTANLVVAVVAVLASAHVEELLPARRGPAGTGVASLVAVLSVAAVVLMPFEPVPGTSFDLAIALVAFFGFWVGAVPAVLAGLTALAMRLAEAGGGLPAGHGSVAGIVLALAVALAGRRPGAARATTPTLALAAAAANVPWLFDLPGGLSPERFALAALAPFGLTFLAVLSAGLLLSSERRRHEHARASARLCAIVEALPDALNVKDREGRFLAANSATARLLGLQSADDLIGKTYFDIMPDETARHFFLEDQKAWRSGTTTTLKQLIGDGRDALALATLKTPLRNARGDMIGLVTHSRDVSARHRLQAELDETHRRLGIALDSMADGLVQIEVSGDIVFCNQRYRELFPKTGHLRVPGANIGDIIRAAVEAGEEVVRDLAELERLLERDGAAVRKGGSNIISLEGDRWIEARTTVLEDGSSLSVLSEITDRVRTQRHLEEVNLRLASQAVTDGLTGIANRRYFDDRLGREFERAAREGKRLGLVLLDVDRFKDFNDRYGHLAGDDCLRLVCRILKRTLGFGEATLARFGGEEFVVLLPEVDEETAVALAEELRASVASEARPHAGSPSGAVTISAGVVCGRPGRDVMSGEQMLSLADTALYRAKNAGRNRIERQAATQLDLAVAALRGVRHHKTAG